MSDVSQQICKMNSQGHKDQVSAHTIFPFGRADGRAATLEFGRGAREKNECF